MAIRDLEIEQSVKRRLISLNASIPGGNFAIRDIARFHVTPRTESAAI